MGAGAAGVAACSCWMPIFSPSRKMNTPAPASAAATKKTPTAFPFPFFWPVPSASTRSPTPVEKVVSRSLGLVETGGCDALLPRRSGEDGTLPRTTNIDPPELLSAACSSPMSANRSSGFLASILRTMASSVGETFGF